MKPPVEKREWWLYEPINPRKGTTTYVREAIGMFKDIPQTPQNHWLRKPAFKVISHDYHIVVVAEKNDEIEKLKKARTYDSKILDEAQAEIAMLQGQKGIIEDMADSAIKGLTEKMRSYEENTEKDIAHMKIFNKKYEAILTENKILREQRNELVIKYLAKATNISEKIQGEVIQMMNGEIIQALKQIGGKE